MHTSELFRLYVSAHKNVHQSTLIEANLSKATHSDTKPHDGDIPFVAVFLAHISFMIVWAIVVFLVSSVCKALEDPPENAAPDKDEIVSIKDLEQHNCKKCQFFNNNYFLKCAVHPTTALTKQALNCSDYSPK
ncbi:MAG: hypothetical protein RMY64_19330 [Nostoc sp. DedQUE08]|uniref:hypothetical protein n=1 Tax=unclassified Nostoc TaxID=2593658 RepID=UPI002AD2E092|nr:MULTISPECIES: hypothetical protein [unclassified Nostoc]MDZ8031922.1 hypothetical protein [Nostoc sp. DedSLP04]MDZ8067744.1 hypothetical protein [Nostoc sp. DedQUE08]MDZ8095914.1 hypothetical protein [Nostoc sp. DedQUE05]MDZ8127561.1 hypothetical protein [Nostoc sp. DedQUE07]